MANIPGNLSKLNDVEISAGSPLTEAVMNKIAANINGLIDITGNYQLFTSYGQFTAPENTNRVFLFGCGGGGGGGKGVGGSHYVGGCGGFGAVPYTLVAPVTPGQTYEILIGEGGSGAKTAAGPTSYTSGTFTFYIGARGSSGGDTIFTSNTSAVTFYGAPGGWGGVYAKNNEILFSAQTGRLAVTTSTIPKPAGIFTVGGSCEITGTSLARRAAAYLSNYTDIYLPTAFPTALYAPAGYNDLSLSGQASPFAPGGTGYNYIGPTTGTGGGGAGFGPGGAGGYRYTNQIESLNFVGRTASVLGGKYLYLNSANDQFKYYLWFNVGGSSTNPNISGRTGIVVNLSAGDSAVEVAAKTAAALDVKSDFIATVSDTLVTVTRQQVGEVTQSVDVNSGVGITLVKPGRDPVGEDAAATSFGAGGGGGGHDQFGGNGAPGFLLVCW